MGSAYHQQLVQVGNRAVVIGGHDGNVTACMYVNARNGLADASPVCSKSFKTVAGARRWADRKLAA
jgi:hypothetical protein